MHRGKIFSILLTTSLLLGLFGGILINQPVWAGEVNPPTPPAGGTTDRDVAADGMAPSASNARTPGGQVPSFMTGIDPNQAAQFVQVKIPASAPSSDGTLTGTAAHPGRPEMTYTIRKASLLVPAPDVLLLEADNDVVGDSPIQLLLQAFGDLGSVDLYDANTATPSLAELMSYDVVVTWSNVAYLNEVAIGNVLADYVDAGGKVINMNFSLGGGGYPIQGRFLTDNYAAMHAGFLLFANACLGSTNPTNPIMYGLGDVCDFYRVGGTVLTPGSSSIAQWQDGQVFVAAKDNRSVVTINAYIGHEFTWSGQMPYVVHNAIQWLVSPEGCDTILWNNGPLVLYLGNGFNSANTSAVQTALSLNTYGFGNQYSLGNRMADEFTITNPSGWQVDQLTFYAYQSGTYPYPPYSTITGVYYQIWNGPPDNPASSVIYGNLATNRMVSTGWIDTYRVLDSNFTDSQRPIMANLASADVHLAPGTYWLDWTIDGTGASGPWAPPVTLLGNTVTGNALQYVGSSLAWSPAMDLGANTPQGMPFLVQGCNMPGAWQQINTNPVPLMDNVLAAWDGEIWSITGYGADGASVYSPELGVWSKVENSSPPFGTNYARSGCQMGNKVYIYGDAATPGFTGLYGYNLTNNTWVGLVPTHPLPYDGIWAPAWVADSATGLCYMTGGAITTGSGDLKTVYVYDTNTHDWMDPLPEFTTARDFHAAFLFTRSTDNHKLLCVAGGINIANEALASTQCYDFNTSSWNAENADLGELPIALWGMGYTQSPAGNGSQLWLVNGVNASTLVTNQTWYFAPNLGSWFNAGPLQSGGVYRTAAVTLNRTVYHVGGSSSGFYMGGWADKYVGFPVWLPLMVK